MEGQLYQAPKLEVTLSMMETVMGIFLSSDRVFMNFENREQLNEFMNRPKVTHFLATLHHVNHANRAGFIFRLGKDFGLKGAKDCGLSVWSEAMGFDLEEGDPEHIDFVHAMDSMDVSEALVLMERQWAPSGNSEELSSIDGSWEAFFNLFSRNSVDVGA